MKTIYFVRHGETANNAAKIYQDRHSTLSEKGRRQAETVAERFSRIPIDIVISSDMDRAEDTAKPIAEQSGKKLVLSRLFREMQRPSAVWNRSHSDPEVIKIRQFTDENFGHANKHSDEENFFDLKTRAEQSAMYLLDRPEATIAAVTHGTYLCFLAGYLIFGETLTADIALSIRRGMFPSNTGITKFVHDTRGWCMWNWNDDAHLG